MTDVDLSAAVPPSARWVKLRYEIRPRAPGARLIARVWSGPRMADPVVIQGASGDVFVRLTTPQKISYQRPVNVDLSLKVTAYKDTAELGE